MAEYKKVPDSGQDNILTKGGSLADVLDAVASNNAKEEAVAPDVPTTDVPTPQPSTPPPSTPPPSSYEDVDEMLLDRMMEILINENSEEMREIRMDILKGIALGTEIQTSRLSAPRNITEVGGYINLLMKLEHQTMVKQTLASILGLPMTRR